MIPSPEELLQQARQEITQGRYVEAARRFEQAAEQLIGRLDLVEAATALVTAGRLYGMGGELAEAEALLEQIEGLAYENNHAPDWALARAELADQRGDPALRRARWALSRDLGGPRQRVFSLGKLADEAKERQAVAEAAAHLSSAAQAAEELEPPLLAEVLVELAVLRTAAGERRSAEALLTRAAGLSEEGSVLRARVEGQRGVIALAEGRADDALRHAQQARAGAVAHQDVPVYLAAAQLITLIHQSRGDELEAWDTLLRARESLRDLLGEQGAALVQPAVQLFEERLGEEAMAALRDAWAARQRSAKP